MDRLKKVISEHAQWDFLEMYINRIETYKEGDFSLAFENTKSMMEAVAKQICEKRGTELQTNSPMAGTMKQAFKALGFSNSDVMRQVSTAMGSIGQHIGNLRNEIGTSAHGQTAEAIKERNNKVDAFSREFLIDTVEILCLYLIRNYESLDGKTTEEPSAALSSYDDAMDFNEFWDEAFGEFAMGEYSFTASEILYNVDKKAYDFEHKVFKDEQENDPPNTTLLL